MAIATNGGHVSRAIDFYNNAKNTAYFIIGGTSPWTHESGIDDSTPITPNITDYKLINVVGLKKIDSISLVRPATVAEVEENEQNPSGRIIKYRDQSWKRIDILTPTKLTATVTKESTAIQVENVAGLISPGTLVRVADTYEGKVVSYSGTTLTLDTPAPETIPSGSLVVGGAVVEGAKYVYVDCTLSYGNFPIVDTENKALSYRQIGLCTGVTTEKESKDILLSADYAIDGINEYTSLGTLEILDNRVPSTRDINQREQLSLIIEF